MLRPRLVALISIILAASLSRLLPHPPNMTSVAAVALFGGAYFSDRRLAFFVPLAALFLSDLFLGFYGHMEVQYLSFALIVCIGLWLEKDRSVLKIAAAALAGSVLFFLLTNFGVWAFGSLYPRTLGGLMDCYIARDPVLPEHIARRHALHPYPVWRLCSAGTPILGAARIIGQVRPSSA